MARKLRSLKIYPQIIKSRTKIGEDKIVRENVDEYNKVKEYNHKQMEKFRNGSNR